MSLKCLFVRRHLEAFVDGELEAGLREEVGSHVAGCLRCRTYVEELNLVRRELKAANPPPVEEAAWDEMWRKIEVAAVVGQTAAAPADRGLRVTHRPVKARYVVAAAAAAAALAFVIGLRWLGSQDTPTMPSTATYINYHENALSDHVLMENQFYSAQTVAVSYEGR